MSIPSHLGKHMNFMKNKMLNHNYCNCTFLEVPLLNDSCGIFFLKSEQQEVINYVEYMQSRNENVHGKSAVTLKIQISHLGNFIKLPINVYENGLFEGQSRCRSVKGYLKYMHTKFQ